MSSKKEEFMVAAGCATIVVTGIIIEYVFKLNHASLVALGLSIVFGVVATNMVRSKARKMPS